MTSETFVVGGPIHEKVVIGTRVRQFAATLGAGHVEALIENRGDHLVVSDAWARPLTDSEYNVRTLLQQHLN